MARGEARLFFDRPAKDIIEFILDLNAYKQVDAKLGKIYRTERTGNEVVFTFQPRLLGLPGPKTTQRVVLAEDQKSIKIGGVPSWTDRLAHFGAFFTFDERDGGTWVTRRVEFTFAKALAWLLDPPFDRWLRKDVAKELAGAKAFLEK
ncbi:SRPBCC family protein [Streptomyces sp. NPDC048434]|uniref:SRPBCC family protein n=1 Tax=Streptomyces sp. NPDC048434 TaxID=3365549 RepID=UPI0037205CFA